MMNPNGIEIIQPTVDPRSVATLGTSPTTNLPGRGCITPAKPPRSRHGAVSRKLGAVPEGKMPGNGAKEAEVPWNDGFHRITHVSRPTLTLFSAS